MKKFILPLALGLLCCAALARPASADLVGTIDTLDLTFVDVGNFKSAHVVTEWTIANGDANSNTSTINGQLYYVQQAPTPDYKTFDNDLATNTTAANSTESYTYNFDVLIYPNYAYNNQFRTEARLFGLYGGDVTKSTTKAY